MARPDPEPVGSAQRRYAAVLLAIFGVVFLALGWSPLERDTWLLENVLVLIALPLLIASRHRLPLSRISYTALFLFLCLHEVGAHFTYSEVPNDEWLAPVLGGPRDSRRVE